MSTIVRDSDNALGCMCTRQLVELAEINLLYFSATDDIDDTIHPTYKA
jgi:hypothetical protein